MEQFKEFINTIHPLSNEAMDLFLSKFKQKRVLKNESLLKIGEISSSVYFVLDGVLRSYVIGDKDKEVNKSIISKGELCASLHSASNNIPSYLGIDCLTDCTLVYLDYKDYVDLYMSNKELSIFSSKVIEATSLKLENHLTKLLSLDATQLYLELCERIPNVDKLIPQKHIASHIGVTPIQLSRIKKKVASE